MIKIYYHVYDDPINKDGTEKPNKFIGEFKILEGEEFIGDGKTIFEYDYIAYGADKDGSIWRIEGSEVSGMICQGCGGLINNVTKLLDTPDVRAFLKYKNK